MIERTYRVSDTVTEQFLRLPMALFANPKYNAMSLEAKFVYALLLDRLSLSQKNGWVNEENEVYLIYTREEIAKLLNITYKKSIGAFKELVDNKLLYEQRQGRGYANLLFVLKPELTEEDAAEFCEEFYESESENTEKEPENPCGTQMCQNGISRTAKTAHLELPNRHIKNCQNGTSRTAETAHLDMPKSHPSNINNINNNITKNDSSQSVSQQDKTLGSEKTVIASAQLDGQTDFTQTLKILDNDSASFEEFLQNCEFEFVPASAQPLFREALEKMYFSPELKIGGVMRSQQQIRERLKMLNAEILQDIHLRFLSANKVDKPIVKRLDYLISMLYNNPIEEQAELSAFDSEELGGEAYAMVVAIHRGYENPWEHRNSENPIIRHAAEQKIIEQQNSE